MLAILPGEIDATFALRKPQPQAGLEENKRREHWETDTDQAETGPYIGKQVGPTH